MLNIVEAEKQKRYWKIAKSLSKIVAHNWAYVNSHFDNVYRLIVQYRRLPELGSRLGWAGQAWLTARSAMICLVRWHQLRRIVVGDLVVGHALLVYLGFDLARAFHFL